MYKQVYFNREKLTDANKKAFPGLKFSPGPLSESWLEIFFSQINDTICIGK